jgi:hypothetical protein
VSEAPITETPPASGIALNWIKFLVELEDSRSSFFQLLYGVPQGSVFVPFCSSCTVISKSGVHHYLFADDTQLLISVSSSEFLHNIYFLEKTIAEICSWMSANLLMLNRSKTDYLLIGLPKQLPEDDNLSLFVPPDVTPSPAASARNLDFQLDSKFSSSNPGP